MTLEPDMGQWGISHHSKSFAMASRLLPARSRLAARVVYAWCRRADDSVDLCPVGEQPQRLISLETELHELYEGRPGSDPVLRAFARVVEQYDIPREYPQDLLRGMRMDVEGALYERWHDLFDYCYCVASTVGLMMCHVMGVSSRAAYSHAAHLGIGMQLTNICRDVAEDWGRGRLYLPTEVLTVGGRRSVGFPADGELSLEDAEVLCPAIRETLRLADEYYVSGNAGLKYLNARCAAAVYAASRVYSKIGQAVAEQDYNVLSPRAFVSRPRKITLCLAAVLDTLLARNTGKPWGARECLQARSIHLASERGAPGEPPFGASPHLWRPPSLS